MGTLNSNSLGWQRQLIMTHLCFIFCPHVTNSVLLPIVRFVASGFCSFLPSKKFAYFSAETNVPYLVELYEEDKDEKIEISDVFQQKALKNFFQRERDSNLIVS